MTSSQFDLKKGLDRGIQQHEAILECVIEKPSVIREGDENIRDIALIESHGFCGESNEKEISFNPKLVFRSSDSELNCSDTVLNPD
jgi:hypothetical protein